MIYNFFFDFNFITNVVVITNFTAIIDYFSMKVIIIYLILFSKQSGFLATNHVILCLINPLKNNFNFNKIFEKVFDSYTNYYLFLNFSITNIAKYFIVPIITIIFIITDTMVVNLTNLYYCFLIVMD